MPTGIIYKATNKENGKAYIGQTKNSLECRIYANFFRGHLYQAFERNSQTHFHRALRKYGKDAFEWEILETITAQSKKSLKTMLDIHEKLRIKQYDTLNSGYNMTEGGDAAVSRKGVYHHSEETRKKLSIANSISLKKPEARKRMSISAKRRVERMKQDGSFNKSVEKLKALMSTEEFKLLHSLRTQQGMTQEVHDKLKASSAKRWAKPEEHVKASLAAKKRKPRKHSEETRIKIAEGLKRYHERRRA